MPFLGMQLWPGAPTDPNQPEQPSIPELLGVLAANIYGDDSRYSAAAGLGSGFANIFGGMRGKREEVQALQQLKGMYPDFQLDKLAAAGIKPSFKDIAELTQQKQADEQLGNLMAQLAQPPVSATGPGVGPVSQPQMTLPQYLRYGQISGKYPPSAVLGLQPKAPAFTTYQQAAAASAGLLDANGAPRLPQNPEEWRQFSQAIQNQTVGTSVRRYTEEAKAKEGIEGQTKYFEKGAAGVLSKWGYDPTKVEYGDPVLSEAGDAIGVDKARNFVSQSERNVYRTAKESMKNIGRMKEVMAAMYKKGLPMDSQTMYAEWLKYHAQQSKDPKWKGVSAYGLGPPRQEYADLFSVIGQVRNRLAPVYMPPGMRSQKFLEQSQEHLPVEGADGPHVLGSIKMLEPLVQMAMDDLAPLQDPRRINAIKRLMQNEDGSPRIDTHTGNPVTPSRAAYLADKVLGITLEDPMQRQPATAILAGPE